MCIWRCRRNGMAGDCKSSDFGHNRFDPYHLHQKPARVTFGYCDPHDEKYSDMYGW